MRLLQQYNNSKIIHRGSANTAFDPIQGAHLHFIRNYVVRFLNNDDIIYEGSPVFPDKIEARKKVLREEVICVFYKAITIRKLYTHCSANTAV